MRQEAGVLVLEGGALALEVLELAVNVVHLALQAVHVLLLLAPTLLSGNLRGEIIIVAKCFFCLFTSRLNKVLAEDLN